MLNDLLDVSLVDQTFEIETEIICVIHIVWMAKRYAWSIQVRQVCYHLGHDQMCLNYAKRMRNNKNNSNCIFFFQGLLNIEASYIIRNK